MSNKVLILVNHDLVIYNFRKELVEKYLEEGFEVFISSPNGERIQQLIDLGCSYIETEINRHGMNPLSEIKLLQFYKKIMKKIEPDIILSYTIKPNIYGGIAAMKLKIPYISNITGLGGSIQSNSLSSKLIKTLYSYSQKKASMTYFQNQSNLDFALTNKIINRNYELLNGSGVNLKEFQLTESVPSNYTNLLYAGRIMNDKGIRELIAAMLKLKEARIKLNLVGFVEDESLLDLITESVQENPNISYTEFSYNIKDFMIESDAIILPSYHEGMSNLLLEGAAIGRPLLASNIPGCKEVIIDDKNGYLFDPMNVDSLVQAIVKFHKLSKDKKIEFGKKSREIVEEKFSRDQIVDKYLQKTKEITDVK